MKKSDRIGFLVTAVEKSLLVRLAELEGGLSQAALMRRLIRQAALEKGLNYQRDCSAISNHNNPNALKSLEK